MAAKNDRAARERQARQLRGQRDQKLREKQRLENEVRANREKIERLKRAYDALKPLVEDAEEIEKIDKHNLKFRTDWKGNRWHSFESNEAALIKQADNDYAKALDWVRDQINLERARLENENTEKYGTIGWLAGRINTLGTQIQNLFN